MPVKTITGKTMAKQTIKFQAKYGETVPLDDAMNFLGFIGGCYEQDDIADARPSNDNDCGEVLRFHKAVKITVTVEISG